MYRLSQKLRQRFSQTPTAGAAVGFLSVFLLFSLSAPETFLSHGSFSSILSSQAVPGIAAIGITLLMISGEFDLSVGSILGVSSLVFLYSAVGGVHILLAGCLGILSGCALGMINGLLLVSTRIPSFIVTLGTMLVYRAISLTGISGGRIIRYADYSRQDPTLAVSGFWILLLAIAVATIALWTTMPTFRRWRYTGYPTRTFAILSAAAGLGILLWSLSAYGASPFATVDLNVFGILNGRIETDARANYRTSILWWLGLTALFAFILFRTRFGNAVFATGGNAEAARVQGIPIDRIRVTNFIISGGLAALAGIIQVARLKSVDPLRGEGLELEIIASVVIGGTLLTGGFGSVIGSAIGTALTGMLRTGLVLVSVPSNAFRGAIGAIMIVAVIINTYVRRDRS